MSQHFGLEPAPAGAAKYAGTCKGLRVEQYYYDGTIIGWADVVVLHADDTTSALRVNFAKERTGWKVKSAEPRTES
jgi:hypothetical protein